MTAQPAQRRPARLTLVELLIIVLLLGGAGFFVVRNAMQAKERAQRAALVAALNEWNPSWKTVNRNPNTAEKIFALVKANPKLHDAKSQGGYLPLHAAVHFANPAMVRLLLDHGADVSAKNPVGKLPLEEAIEAGHTEIVELLLAKGAGRYLKEAGWSTPLFLATAKGYKGITELLLAYGADANAKGDGDATPLFNAVGGGHREVAELLLANGADINAKNKLGWTPLHLAVRVIYKGPTASPLPALWGGGRSALRVPTAAGVSPLPAPWGEGRVDFDKIEALRMAARDAKIELVRMLLQKGAEVNAKDNYGETPLDYVKRDTDQPLINLLRQHGAKE